MTSPALWPCGCLRNDAGAHRGTCPDFATVRLVEYSNRLEDLTWIRRDDTSKETR